VLDLSTPRPDGAIVVATAGHLALLLASGGVQRFARGPAGYANPGGEEPYFALSSGERVASAGCTFPQQTLYVLRLQRGTGVTAVNPRRFMYRHIPRPMFPFDDRASGAP